MGESLKLSKGHNHHNHVNYRLHLFAFSISCLCFSTSDSTSFHPSSHPSVLRCGHIGFLQYFTEKKGSLSVAISNQVTFKPSSFSLINVVNLSDPTCTCREICMGIGEIYHPQVKFSITYLNDWIFPMDLAEQQ